MQRCPGSASGVTIKQQIRWAEVLVGWDQAEKCPAGSVRVPLLGLRVDHGPRLKPLRYLISDPSTNRDLFVAAERTDGVMGMLGRQAPGLAGQGPGW
eukprot:Skav233060  [mRNA]  locus=scaffold1001:24367:25290:- [translate_table: standard]